LRIRKLSIVCAEKFPRVSLLNLADSMGSKVIMVGASGAGKTALLTRMRDDDYTDNQLATVGNMLAHVDRNFGTEDSPDRFSFQLWDTAGQERFRSLTPVYSRDAACVLLVFDITSRQSFTDLPTWYNLVRLNTQKGCRYIVVGAKGDLEEQAAVKEWEMEKYQQTIMNSEGCILVSSKPGEHVDVLLLMIRDAIDHARPQVEQLIVGVALSETGDKPPAKNCRC
jgi:small GTP-binding protein